MTIYVDDSNELTTVSGYDMVLCRLFADTEDELHAAAKAAGGRRSMFRRCPKDGPLYRISAAKRSWVIALCGAVEVTCAEANVMLRRRLANAAAEEKRRYFARWRPTLAAVNTPLKPPDRLAKEGAKSQ
jgi:hypothetical protein